jgi:hypothetical protein
VKATSTTHEVPTVPRQLARVASPESRRFAAALLVDPRHCSTGDPDTGDCTACQDHRRLRTEARRAS